MNRTRREFMAAAAAMAATALVPLPVKAAPTLFVFDCTESMRHFPAVDFKPNPMLYDWWIGATHTPHD